MSIRHTRGTGYSGTAPAEAQLFIRHKRALTNGSVPAILCCHSHNNTLDQYTPGLPTEIDPGWHAWMLAQSGYLLLAVEHAGIAAWSNANAMSRMDDAYTYATGLGAKTGKVAVMGYSMGGLTALNWIKRNPTLVSCAWLWAPVTDLDWARTQGTWGTEITAAYPSGSAGFNVHDEPQSWRGVCPIVVAHAGDDTVVPSSQTDTFVAAVNDPLVTKRTVSSGGHVDLFSHVPESETVQFYRAHMTLALTILIVAIAAFILERRLMVRDQHAREREWATDRERLLNRMRDERHDWANERSALLDRIKPETAQPPPHLPGVETFQPPVDDAEFWDRAETE